MLTMRVTRNKWQKLKCSWWIGHCRVGLIKVPLMDRALPRWIATDTCWNRYAVSLMSPVASVHLLSMSCRNFEASVFNAPVVSTAKAVKVCVWVSSWYVIFLLVAALSAAADGVMEVRGRWVVAKVSGTVTSHATYLPRLQGIIVTPSWRLQSSRSKHNGSFIDGMPARRIALPTMSLMELCLICLPAFLRHDSPWMPRASAFVPQTQMCGWHSSAPKRTPAEILTSSSDIRRPTDVIGGAKSQSPSCGCFIDMRRALSKSEVAFTSRLE